LYVCSRGTCRPSCTTADDCSYYLPFSHSVQGAAPGSVAALWPLCTAGVCGATSALPAQLSDYSEDSPDVDCFTDADCAAGAASKKLEMFCSSTCLDLVDNHGRLADKAYLAPDRGICADRFCPDKHSNNNENPGCAEGYECKAVPDFDLPKCIGSGAQAPATDSAPKSAAAARTVHAMALGAAACLAAVLLM
jgi:hypothetical protein